MSWGEMSETVQGQACLKHAPEGLIYYSCGVCLRLSPEQTQRIETQFDIMTGSLFTSCRLITQEVPKHGESLWQKDHWKAKDAQKGARKHNQDSIELRWINDDIFRASQAKIRMDKRI